MRKLLTILVCLAFIPAMAFACETPANNTYYYLNDNTTLCTGYYSNVSIQFNSSNIYLDCDNSEIDGEGYSAYGIIMTFVSNVSVSNCTIHNYTSGGIQATTSQNTRIYNNYIYDFGVGIGINYAASSLNATIYNNTIETIDYGNYGMTFAGSPRANITGNTITGSVIGIRLLSNDNATIINNTITATSVQAMHITASSDNNYFKDNTDINSTSSIHHNLGTNLNNTIVNQTSMFEDITISYSISPGQDYDISPYYSHPSESPDNYNTMNKYLIYRNTGALGYAPVKIFYTDNEVLSNNIQEDRLQLFEYNAVWYGLSSVLNTAENSVYYNFTTDSDIGLFGFRVAPDYTPVFLALMIVLVVAGALLTYINKKPDDNTLIYLIVLGVVTVIMILLLGEISI